MPTEIIGSYHKMIRMRTGLFSLDLAMANKVRGEIGLPRRTMTELYGWPESGKSSLAYYLASKVAASGQVTICDVENADPDYVKGVFDAQGFDGKVWMIESFFPDKEIFPLSRLEGRKTVKVGTARYHEEMLRDMVRSLAEPNVHAAILDSVGAVQSLAEADGDFGEAFMGKRAKFLNQVSRAISGILRNKETPANVFVVNHVQKILGGQGHTTPGGEGVKFLSRQRIMIWPKVTWKLKEDDPESPLLGFQVGGQMEKHTHGGKGRQFEFFIVPGYGVHPGASAMLDAIHYGLVEKSGAYIKIDGKSVGAIRRDLLAYAARGKERKFDPFQELLQRYEETLLKEMTDVREVPDFDTEDGAGDSLQDESDDNGASPVGTKRTKARSSKRKN